MKRSLALITLLFPMFVLSGCSNLFSDKQADETAGWSAQQLYKAAKDYLDDGAYENAIKNYEKLEARFPYGRFAQQAQIEITYAYFKQNDVEATVASAERFVKLHPNHPNVDYAHYLKGLTYFNQDIGFMGKLAEQDQSERDPKALRNSFDAFKELTTRFPQSKYTPDALDRMKYLVNALSSHEVHVARYYYRRGAYVAAGNRVRFALQTYPQTPALEEGLFILVKSYDALGLNDLRDDANQVMLKNFPNSAYFKGATKVDEPWWKLWNILK